MASPRLVLRTPRYTEGVVLDGSERLFFSMTQSSQIGMCSLRDGAPQLQIWAHLPGANGHAIEPSGTHVVMSSTGAIVRLDETGRIVKVIATHVDHDPLVYPNGVTLDPHRGGFYATDSGYKQTPKHIDGTPRGRIVRVDADDRVRVVAEGIAYANGVGLALDGRRLYVTESTSKLLACYEVDDDGALHDRRVLVQLPVAGGESVPDGITVLPDGRVSVAHYGAGEVLVYEPDGRLAQRVPAGNKATSHVAFDPPGRCMYVSGGIESEQGEGAIFAVELG